MKKLLLSLTMVTIAFGAIGQTEINKGTATDTREALNPNEEGTNRTLSVPKPYFTDDVNRKKESIEDWYSFPQSIDGLFGNTRLFAPAMFPSDSAVMRFMDNGTPILDTVTWTSVGAVFDPKDEVYGAVGLPQLSEYNPFTVDSIDFLYFYDRVTDATVTDTLVLQIYGMERVDRYTWTASQERFASVRYDRSTKQGLAYASGYQEIEILLTPEDTHSINNGSFANITTAITPLTIDADDLSRMAATITFKPGSNYIPGDTIGPWENPVPHRRHNIFRFGGRADDNETILETYNNGLLLDLIQFSENRLGDDFGSRYAPSSFYVTRQYPEIAFHISSPNVGVQEKNSNATLGKAYPNPVLVGDDISIDFALTSSADVTLEIYNMIGQKMSTVANDKFSSGEHSVKFNTSTLRPGLYLYTMKAGNYSKTYRFSVSD
ncbi:MAG: T9SS type A sorting domain-containing protein [Bacteroidia bacterium]